MKPKKTAKYPCIVQNFLNLAARGQLREAVDALPSLSRRGVRLSSDIIASLLRRISDAGSIREGKLVHLHLKRIGSKHPSTYIANHLIDMYAKCGDHLKARDVFDKMRVRNLYSWNNLLSGYAKLGMAKAARKLFDKMPERDFVSWNTMVMAYVQSGWFDEAVRCYVELRRSDIGYNEYSFSGVLTVCVKMRALWLAKQLHCQVFVLGFLSNAFLSSSVVDAYAKCGDMGDARRLFDEMKWRDVVTWTTLLSGYAKEGDMKSAREIFYAMPEKNSVSWTALISGYAQNGMGNHALVLFKKMIALKVEPDPYTYSSCFFACASTISPLRGMQLHSHLITAGIRPNVAVVSSLIDMYSKCGSLDVAKNIFDATENKENVVLWNTIISALAHHGCGREATNIFVHMLKLGVKPDDVTFLVLLNACSHSGLVREGVTLFRSMKEDYNIDPKQEHYACLIDLLGRSGYFDEMMNLLKRMPFKPEECVWNALIGVCKIHGNVELSRIVMRHLVEIDPHSSAAYLLLSAIYASLGRWESAKEVRDLMHERGIEKDRALSWVEVDRLLQLDSKPNTSHHLGRNTTSVLELLADETALYNVER